MSEDFSALKQKKVKGLLKGQARRTSGSYSKTSNSSEVLTKTFKMKQFYKKGLILVNTTV